MSEDDLGRLEEALGYRFRDRGLLSHALTHSSRKSELQVSNERLEFLGDAILGLIVSEHLYRAYEDFTEGDLTSVKSRVVSRPTLVRAARRLGLGAHLLVAKGVARDVTTQEEADAAESARKALPAKLLSDALEAIIAAVYLDAGADAAQALVLRLLGAEIQHAVEAGHAQNFKSLLQQFAQREMSATPSYRVVAEEGPDHVKMFEVVTIIQGAPYGTGRGATKKAAEQMAAQNTLAMLTTRRLDAQASA